MVQNLKERPKRPVAKQSRSEHREELMQSYRKAAQKNFKVEKQDLKNDLIISKLKKYMNR